MTAALRKDGPKFHPRKSRGHWRRAAAELGRIVIEQRMEIESLRKRLEDRNG